LNSSSQIIFFNKLFLFVCLCVFVVSTETRDWVSIVFNKNFNCQQNKTKQSKQIIFISNNIFLIRWEWLIWIVKMWLWLCWKEINNQSFCVIFHCFSMMTLFSFVILLFSFVFWEHSFCQISTNWTLLIFWFTTLFFGKLFSPCFVSNEIDSQQLLSPFSILFCFWLFHFLYLSKYCWRKNIGICSKRSTFWSRSQIKLI
jgi:hypothetical protein